MPLIDSWSAPEYLITFTPYFTKMIFEFIPHESDYLSYLFYVTTKSKRVQKKRTINKMVILFIYFISGLYLYNSQGPIPAALFFILCLPTYFLYNYFEKKQYRKHFTRYIGAHFSEEIGVTTTIHLDDEGVTVSVGESETKMPWSEIEEINETGTLILIQEKNQNTIVIPKNTSRVRELADELKRFAMEHIIPYQEELNWKWK